MTFPLSHNAIVRIQPFAQFKVLLALRGVTPEDGRWGVDPRWIYGLSLALVGALLLWWRREYGELSRPTAPTAREALVAVAVGLVVLVLWVLLDHPALRLGTEAAQFVPLDAQGRIEWPLVAVRWIGAAVLVPVMEELFWRSFLMRWIDQHQFETVPPQRVGLRAIVLSTFVFMLAHTLWLAAIIAGLAYALLYVKSGKLWLPVIAHAVTNGGLGIYVVVTGQWQFW
jgi:CAAX prenyl protease-like protein